MKYVLLIKLNNINRVYKKNFGFIQIEHYLNTINNSFQSKQAIAGLVF